MLVMFPVERFSDEGVRAIDERYSSGDTPPERRAWSSFHGLRRGASFGCILRTIIPELPRLSHDPAPSDLDANGWCRCGCGLGTRISEATIIW